MNPVASIEILKSCIAEGTTADDLDLHAADLNNANFRDSRLTGCNLEDALLDGSDWSMGTIRMCDLNRVHASGARFEGTRLEDSTAEAADFSRANFRGAHLSETSFARATLRGAVLDNAEGDGVEFRGADLRGAILVGARLDEADFRGADLRGADLAQTRFHGADFRGAILDETAFVSSDCEGAFFDQDKNQSKESTLGSDEFTALRELLTSLPETLAGRTNVPPELLEQLRHAGDVLDENEPPEKWKPWLEPLMNVAQGKPSLEEVFAAVQSAAGKLPPEEIQAWLETIAKKNVNH